MCDCTMGMGDVAGAASSSGCGEAEEGVLELYRAWSSGTQGIDPIEVKGRAC